MTARCPNNSDHKTFETSVHVAQFWEVDKNGNFISVLNDCSEIDAEPCKENIWICCTCGAEAIVEDD